MFVGWAVVRRREFAEIAKRIAETLKWLIEAAYAGRKIMVWAPVAPAPPSSLEARLHRLCAPEVFLPARGASRLRSLFAAPISLRIPKYKVETVANPS
jgi:hypothetical protein